MQKSKKRLLTTSIRRRSVYAELKATRAATRLGLRLLPDELQGEVGEALVGLFEKELGTLLDKAL